MKYFSTLLALALTTRSDKNKALAQSVPKFGLPAGFGGTEQGDGNMFEIVAKDQPVLIERLDINMGAGTEPVEVYYRLGHVDNQYDDSYKLIFSGDITGAGKGLVTSLPSFTSPVLVTPGTPVTFYVTIANFYGTNMWYSVGVGSGTAYASDPNIDIIEGYANPYAGSDVIEGYANGYPWTGYTSDRQWNGVVYYSFQTTSSPTASPTKRLTASPVTNPPSVGNPSPTATPVATQTRSPTIIEVDVENRPSSQPTISPSSFPSQPSSRPISQLTISPSSLPSSQLSPRPSSLPTSTSSPSSSQILQPSESPTRAPTNKPTTTEADDLESPTKSPTPAIRLSTPNPTKQSTMQPTKSPVTKSPTASPITSPPSIGNPNPTASPVATQTRSPTIIVVDDNEVESPTKSPTESPTKSPNPILLRSAPTTLSTTVEVEEDDTIWFTDLLPVFDSYASSASFNRFSFMGWMCSSSCPLFIIAFFVL